MCDVVMHPLETQHLVLNAVVATHAALLLGQLSERQKSKHI